MNGRARWGAASAVGVLGAIASASAGAQAIEHRRSPVPPPRITTTVSPKTRLRAITIDGAAPKLDLGLAPFIGQPLTPDLIHRVEAAIGRRLSDGQHTVTAAWTPAPDAAPGTLNLTTKRVRIGHVTTTGASPREAAYVAKRLGLTSGAVLDQPTLDLKLDSLNRYPYRQVAVTVSPTSDTTVAVTETPPWSFTAADKYAGGPHESWRRLTATATVGGLLGADSVTALQLTAAPDFFTRANPHPRIADAYLTWTKPTGTRGTLEASVDVGGQTFRFLPDVYWVSEVDGTADYRYLLTAPSGGHGESDIRAGVDFRHERVFHTQGGPVLSNTAAAFDELFAGYHRNDQAAAYQSDFDISLRLSPGGVDPGNSNAHVAAYSGGRMASARYGYLYATWDRTSDVGKTLQWHSLITAMAATSPLPYWDQMILGGHDYVRGYYMADFSCDDALIWRNEVSLKVARGPAPFILADIGAGRDIATHISRTLASFGAGVTLPLSKHTTFTVDAVRTLRPAPVTRSGATSVEFNLGVKF